MEKDWIQSKACNDSARLAYTHKRVAHWDEVAHNMDARLSWGAYYHSRLAGVYRFLIPPGRRVLEIGCGPGDLLAALKPGLGVGVDFSKEMIEHARQRHPDIELVNADAHDLGIDGVFDYILLSDTINDLWDVQTVFEKLGRLCSPQTRLILNFYSHLWEKPLAMGQRMERVTPTLPQNWLTVDDVANLLNLTDFEVIRHWEEIVWPFSTPFLTSLANKYLVKFWPFNVFALTNFMMCRPLLRSKSTGEDLHVSVIIPSRNEAGNISQILARTPEMGRGTEFIFVEGHSTDNTYAAIEQAIDDHPQRNCRLLRQPGRGKGDAVRFGFTHASGDVLMILDADMTVPPEDLPRFYEALHCGKGEFINGVRLVYPMELQAMRFLNLVGNKFFSLAFSWLLSQPIKDTLCGTKVLTRENYRKIAENRGYFGEFDPFGDFDLIFGAAKLNLKIVDLPIRYRERVYGSTNIERWKHGWMLIKMVAFAARRIKFV